MKQSHINLLTMAALAACAGTASAQSPAPSSVAIYGIVDVAVEHLNNTAAGNGLTRMPNLTGTVPSRLGLRGAEALGNGLSANFALEMGFGPETGVSNQGGRLFGRQAWVGLTGPWGALSFGRQNTMLFWALTEANVLGAHMQSISNLDAYIPNARADNSVAYRGTFSGVTVGATYSLGRDAVNAGPSPSGTNCAGENAADSSACREWSVLLKYDAPAWGAAFAVDELSGGTGAFGALTNSGLTDRRTTLNGYVRLAGGTLGAGVIRRDNEGSAATPESDLWFLGASYPVLPKLTVDAQWSRLNLKASGNDADLLVLRSTYALSKRSAVYASVAHVKNDGAAAFSASSAQAGGAPAAGASQSGLGVGIRHTF